MAPLLTSSPCWNASIPDLKLPISAVESQCASVVNNTNSSQSGQSQLTGPQSLAVTLMICMYRLGFSSNTLSFQESKTLRFTHSIYWSIQRFKTFHHINLHKFNQSSPYLCELTILPSSQNFWSYLQILKNSCILPITPFSTGQKSYLNPLRLSFCG